MLNFYLIALIFLTSSICYAQLQKDDSVQNVKLAITVLDYNSEKKRQAPIFIITIYNQSPKDQKILDLEKRKDLSHSQLDITISQSGHRVRTYKSFSNPYPITENDYIILSPKAAVSFLIDTYDREYHLSNEGLYQLTAEFWNYPYFKIRSKPIYFRVIRK
ncbi:hypothetical protein ACFL9T_17675 [Thermodesulfobacteriota bacterium]